MYLHIRIKIKHYISTIIILLLRRQKITTHHLSGGYSISSIPGLSLQNIIYPWENCTMLIISETKIASLVLITFSDLDIQQFISAPLFIWASRIYILFFSFLSVTSALIYSPFTYLRLSHSTLQLVLPHDPGTTLPMSKNISMRKIYRIIIIHYCLINL